MVILPKPIYRFNVTLNYHDIFTELEQILKFTWNQKIKNYQSNPEKK